MNAILGVRGVALYSLAAAVAGKIPEVSNAVIQPLLPALSAAYAKRDRSRLQHLAAVATDLNCAALFLGSAALLWLAPYASRILSPTDNDVVTQLIRIIAAVMAVAAAAQAGHLLVIAAGRPAIAACAAALGSSVALAGIWWLASKNGLPAQRSETSGTWRPGA